MTPREPFALQPLVENAVRHGLSGKPNGGTITITAENAGAECVIIVEDDGVLAGRFAAKTFVATVIHRQVRCPCAERSGR